MCPILDGYGVMGIFKFPYTPSCEPRLTAGVSYTQVMDVADVIRNVSLNCSRGTRPSDSLYFGRRWHFRKPALSTDKFQLKVISRS